MRVMAMCRRIIVAALCASASAAYADVTMSQMFSDNMVLQRNMKVPVWGQAKPGEKVTVAIAGKQAVAKANAKGEWMAKLGPLTAGGPYTLSVTGLNKITLTNVLVGEVWICSGQSNMELGMTQVKNSGSEIAAANCPQIRLFTVKHGIDPRPQHRLSGEATWLECSPKTVVKNGWGGFSGVGYFFGRALQEKLKVPVGMINIAIGGSSCQSWISADGLKNMTEFTNAVALLKAAPDFSSISDQVREDSKKGGDSMKRAIEAWCQANDPGKKLAMTCLSIPWNRNQAMMLACPPAQVAAMPPERDHNFPGVLFNGMISPVIPFGIRGVIWYQGENDVGRSGLYGKLLTGMIKDWRTHWGQGDFPFGIVQLPPFNYGGDNSPKFAELCNAQLIASKTVPNAGLVVTTDIGDAGNIHPNNKQDVGKRLALWAQAKVYGDLKLVYSGPIYDSMTVAGKKIKLQFKQCGGGLVSSDSKPLREFTIAGPDKVFHPANAEISGNTVVVSSDAVAAPVAVRHAWQQTPNPNLANKEGLPASLFRTDDLPGVSVKAK